MKIRSVAAGLILTLAAASRLSGQVVPNCFLEDRWAKDAIVPPCRDAIKTSSAATVTVSVDAADEGPWISPYLTGTAVTAWTGPLSGQTALMEHLDLLAPPVLRYPGGNWSDIFFWDGTYKDVPDSVPDGTATGRLKALSPQSGANSWTLTLDDYYRMRDRFGCEGLMTVNYAYARYGTGPDPVGRAARYAADWVRADAGRTRFWEVGNEDDGPWQPGFKIDTGKNRDGQPELISGELYGRHFRAFADSMRKAADDIGATIYIGAQIMHEDRRNYWNVPDRSWNAGVFREAGDSPDYYVVHNYFAARGSDPVGRYCAGADAIDEMMTFIKKDIAEKNAAVRPVALTEWNIDLSAAARVNSSFADAMQSVLVFGKLARNGYGMSCRWLVAGDGFRMFYESASAGTPKWNPQPDYFTMYFLQRTLGDRSVSVSVSGSSEVEAFASTFNRKAAGVVVVNKGKTERTVSLDIQNHAPGSAYYLYTLTGGNDDPDYPQTVIVNAAEPDNDAGGPIGDLETIEAYRYAAEGGVVFQSPGRSIQYVIVEGVVQPTGVSERGHRAGAAATRKMPEIRVFPSPARDRVRIDADGFGCRRIEIIDILGRIVYAKDVDPSVKIYDVDPGLPSGRYFIRVVRSDAVVRSKLFILR
jgi:hypothetical protein